MVHRMSRRSIGSPRSAFAAAALCIMTLEACATTRPLAPGVLYIPAVQPFAISLVPAVPVPIRLGAQLGFSVSSGTAGYYSLYLIDPASEVWVLGENMPLGAGSVTYPSPPAQDFTLTAAEPLGRNRVNRAGHTGSHQRFVRRHHGDLGGQSGHPGQHVRGAAEPHDPLPAVVGLGHRRDHGFGRRVTNGGRTAMTGTRTSMQRRQARSRLTIGMLLASSILCYQAGSGASALAELGQVSVIENRREPFSISLVPAVPVPIRIRTNLGFNVSSETAGYYSLYLIDPVGEVWVLAENMPLPAGSITYPSPPAQNFTLAAAEPLGTTRVILVVTREQLAGFSGNATVMRRAVSLAVRGDPFVRQLNAKLAILSPSDWATDEITVRVVA